MSIFTKFIHRLKNESISYGLDIGHSAIRCVKVLHQPKGPLLVGLSSVSLPEGLVVEGEIQKVSDLADLIHPLLAELNYNSDDADLFVSLSVSPLILSDRVSVTLRPDIKESVDIEEQINSKPPFDDKEIYHDHIILKRENKVNAEVLVVAAKNQHLDKWAGHFKAMELKPRGLDVDCFATYNAFSLQMPHTEAANAIALLNIGQHHSFITFVVEGHYHSTRILDRISVSQLIRTLQTRSGTHTTQLTDSLFSENDNPKRFESLNQVNSAVSQAVHFFHSSAKGLRLEQIYLCGGGGNIPGLAELIKENQRIKVVEPFNVLSCIATDPKNQFGFDAKKSCEYAVALGLALRKV